MEASSEAVLSETIASGIWEGGENLQTLLEHSVAPIKTGTGKSNRHGEGEGRSCHREKPVSPLKSPRGRGRVSGGGSVL